VQDRHAAGAGIATLRRSRCVESAQCELARELRGRIATEAAMNEPWLLGKWNELKGKAKQRWARLTHNDLMRVEGDRDQLVGAIQQRYGKAKDVVLKELESWERKHGYR
jgi:uncharacterized protein YjbJ (UPF0337 family)